MARIINFSIVIIFILSLSGCIHNQQNQRASYSYYDSSTVKARENSHLVLNYLHKGYTDYAQEKLHIALHQAPNDPVVLDTAGYYYEKTGRIKLANRYYKQAVVAAPNSGIAKNNYGAFLCRNGYYKASIPYFLEASKTPRTPITREALENAKFCEMKIKTRLGVSTT